MSFQPPCPEVLGQRQLHLDELRFSVRELEEVLRVTDRPTSGFELLSGLCIHGFPLNDLECFGRPEVVLCRLQSPSSEQLGSSELLSLLEPPQKKARFEARVIRERW